MTIQDIIQGCKKADRRAQRLLYDTYANKYFKVAMRYLKQREDAEDCIEESFVKIFHNILSFQYQELNSFEVWMKRIIVNEALMLLRKRNKFDFININETPENQTITTDFDNIDVQKIITLVETLPDGYRTVFNLYAIEGYDHSEIGGMLHISESTSKSQLFKARRMLKVKLEKILNITQL